MHRRLLALARDARFALILTILVGLLAGLLAIGQAYLVSGTVSGVFLEKRTLLQVWPWMQMLLAVIAARGLATWLGEVAANAVAVRIKTDLREKLFAHILALGPAFTRAERTGELTSTAVEGIEALDAYFSQYLPQLVVSTLVPLSVLVLVFPLDPLSGIVLLVTAPLIPFFMYMIGRGAEVLTKRQYETLSRLSVHFLDSLQGLTTLKLFGQSKAQARNIAAVSDQYRLTTLKVLQVTFLSAFALELLATISTAIIAVEVGLRLLYAQMEFREALFLLILAPEFYLPLRMLGMRFHAGMAGTSAARRIFEVLDIREPIIDIRKSEADDHYAPAEYRISNVDLSNLSYVYPGSRQPALQSITLTIPAGQHIAVVGPSGAGKSTLASLLLRFMEPTEGEIRVDGQPLHGLPLEEWRRQISWVPQRPHLFHDTIAANIRLGKLDASLEEIAAAARLAHLDEFIESLPEKYETPVGEGGARLSSGQAQRLALARAFLKDAPILILDEPTSSVDPETEAWLEESTQGLMQGRTVITIAHRLNTVIHADQVVVMDHGRIVERGRHEELVSANGLYAKIVKKQRFEGRTSRVERQTFRAAPRMSDLALRAPNVGSGEVIPIPPSQSSGTSLFFRLSSFLAGSWGWIALSVLLGSLTIGASVALMGTSAWLISMAALHPSIAALEVAIVGVRFFGIARAVFRYLERLVSHNVTLELLGRLRVWFYEKLEPLAPARLMEYRAGDLMARIISDVNTLENFYVRIVAPPIIAFLVCTGAALFLWLSHPAFAVILIAAFFLLGTVLPAIVQVASRSGGQMLIGQRAELSAQLVDGIQGLPDVLAFGQGRARLEQAQVLGRQYGSSQRRLAAVSGVQSGASIFFSNLAMWWILYMAIPQVASGALPGVMLAPLALLTLASFEATAPLPLAAQLWASTRSAAQRLFEVVDVQPEVQENREPRAESRAASGRVCLQISDLSFTYPGQHIPVLQEVSLKLQTGSRMAIVGPSGAGKSTLSHLVMRFWEFHSGEVCLDGRSIRDDPADEVRQQVALVSGAAHFFDTTIYENLRMARRKVTREQVEAAARAARIHGFIMGLPNGYDTPIGEHGLRLSGGERQRLAIARAVLKDAPILILDEPTANLDALTEREVLDTLFELMRYKAGLLITHRLIGLEQMDQILVMDHGRVVEQGTQAELLRSDGLYRRLWDLQNQALVQA